MYRFKIEWGAAPDETFAPDAFDNNVGKPTKVTMDQVSFPGTLVAAEVAPDGRRVSLTIEVPDSDCAPCRLMPTRRCPSSYRGPCGDWPCARLESDDETLWR